MLKIPKKKEYEDISSSLTLNKPFRFLSIIYIIMPTHLFERIQRFFQMNSSQMKIK